MNTKQLMKAVSAELNISDKLSAAVIKSVIKQIVKASVAGERVTLREFGTFDIREFKSVPGVNPRNPEIKLMRPAYRKIGFKCSDKLRKFLSQGM